MAAKMAQISPPGRRSGCQDYSRRPRRQAALSKRGNSAKIHPGLGFIWGIPVEDAREAAVEIQLTLTAEQTVIGEAVSLAKGAGAEVSEPEAASVSGALNAGISFEDVKTVIEVVTIILTTGKAAFEFLKAMRQYLRERAPNSVAALNNAQNGSLAGRVRADSSDAELQELVKDVTG